MIPAESQAGRTPLHPARIDHAIRVLSKMVPAITELISRARLDRYGRLVRSTETRRARRGMQGRPITATDLARGAARSGNPRRASTPAHRDVVLFIDEVDTEIDGRSIFQKLIAPINGDKFFFQEKEVSFAKQNIVGFYALSSHRDFLEKKPKWPDFLSRIPTEHRFVLPKFDNPFERLFRVISMLNRGATSVTKVSVHALLYLALRDWSSAREMDQALELAKARLRDPSAVLDLQHVASCLDDVMKVDAKQNDSIAIVDNDTVEMQS
ncbi:hypothetical protein J7E62_01715 [Variovorax paradoxus]|nr:hypothetical protein [Variovorax paradoxus]